MMHDDDQLAEMVEVLRRALMKAHAHDWSMEVVAEAAHICALASLRVARTEVDPT